MGKLRQTLSTLLAIGILTACALAQTSLTQVRDTINNPNGTPFNGTLVITWVGLSSPASGSVSPLSTSAHIYNGALSVLLVPSTTAAAGSYYQVVYNSNDALVTWAETWSVPGSSTALTVSSVRTSSTSGSGTSTGMFGTTTGAGGTQYATLPIALSQVTGLTADLNTLNTSLATLQTTVDGLTSTVLPSLTNTVNGLSTTVAALGTSVATDITNITALTNTVGGLSTTVTGLGTSSSANTTNIAALTNTVGGLSTTVTGLGTSVAANITNITALTNTVGGLSTSSASNGSTVSALSTTVGGLSSSLATLSAAVTVLQASGINKSIAVTFIDGEVPAGVTNGSNAAFTLSQGPTPAGSLELYRNGLVQTSGVDYTISGTAVTFLSGDIPAAGDVLQAYYRTIGSSPAPTFVDNEVPGGLLNGSNLTFSLASAPTSQAALKLYKNGLLMQLHSDYTLSGAIITFGSASTPQPGDAVVAYYR